MTVLRQFTSYVTMLSEYIHAHVSANQSGFGRDYPDIKGGDRHPKVHFFVVSLTATQVCIHFHT